AGGPLPARQEPAELRQATAARLSRRPEAGRPVGRRPAAPAAPSGGGPGDERAVPRGVPPDHGSVSCDRVMRIAPEGSPFILPGWTLVLLGAWVARGSAWLWVPEGLLLLLAVWLLVFFRDPPRTGPRGDGYVIAPADGRIVDIAVVDEPMYLHAASDKASLDNEQASVGLRTAPGPLLVRQIAGLIARRIVTDGRPGESAAQGARMGMIRFGSRVDVFLASAAPHAVRVAVGDR